MKQWLNQHKQALSLVMHRLQLRWLNPLLIGLVIGVTLAIPALIYMGISQAHQAISNVKQETQLSVFLDADVDKQQIELLGNTLRANSAIQSVQFVAKEDALKQLMARTGNQELITTLESNPLPDAFLITPAALDEAAVGALTESLSTQTGVESVVVDSAWIKRLNSLLSLGEQAVWIVGGLLAFAVVAVISNIIRMQVLTHKEEIEVSELFGATKSFVRRPFLYLGSLFGLAGGLFACVILWAVAHVFNQALTGLASAYQADFSAQLNPAGMFPWLLLLATGLGWLAAYVAVAFQSNNT